ncbi:hypothetical protein [Desulfogranum japonicum]|nr:hypothetical protein [Desulfogranum japonicum]
MARLAVVHLQECWPMLFSEATIRQVCFASEEDYAAYIGWLAEYAKK